MTRLIARLVALFAFAVGDSTANAQESIGYICLVKGSHELSAGVLKNWALAHQINNLSFRINRQTGVMIGDFSSQEWHSTTVLDYGSSQQSYKVLYMSPPNTFIHVRLLEILEYQDGPETDFMFIDGTTVHTGKCRR